MEVVEIVCKEKPKASIPKQPMDTSRDQGASTLTQTNEPVVKEAESQGQDDPKATKATLPDTTSKYPSQSIDTQVIEEQKKEDNVSTKHETQNVEEK